MIVMKMDSIKTQCKIITVKGCTHTKYVHSVWVSYANEYSGWRRVNPITYQVDAPARKKHTLFSERALTSFPILRFSL